MKKYLAVFLMFCAFSKSHPAHADGWERYGITHVPSQQEQDEDQKYGGYPNNKDFNNDTKCSKVVALFNTAGMNSTNSRMVNFSNYTDMSFAQADILSMSLNKTPSLLDKITAQEFTITLSGALLLYCEKHKKAEIGKAIFEIYGSAQENL